MTGLAYDLLPEELLAELATAGLDPRAVHEANAFVRDRLLKDLPDFQTLSESPPIRAHRLPAGTPVFNAYELGGWITWRHPDLDQYVDGLITPYSLDHVEGYHRTQVLLPGWYAVVRDSQAPVVA